MPILVQEQGGGRRKTCPAGIGEFPGDARAGAPGWIASGGNDSHGVGVVGARGIDDAPGRHLIRALLGRPLEHRIGRHGSDPILRAGAVDDLKHRLAILLLRDGAHRPTDAGHRHQGSKDEGDMEDPHSAHCTEG